MEVDARSKATHNIVGNLCADAVLHRDAGKGRTTDEVVSDDGERAIAHNTDRAAPDGVVLDNAIPALNEDPGLRDLDDQIPVPDRDTVPGYGLVGFAGSWRVLHGWSVRTRLDNLADRRYETYIGFPGPGRSFWVGLGWDRL